MKYAIVLLFLLLVSTALSQDESENAGNGRRRRREVIFTESIYFGSDGNAPSILSVLQGQRPEDACSEFLHPFQLPADVKVSVLQQLLNGICSRIAAIPNIQTPCDSKPPTEIVFEIDMSDFKKDHFSQELISSEQPANSIINFRLGYTIYESIAIFCTIRSEHCVLRTDASSDDNERFLLELEHYAEKKLSDMQLEENERKISERLKSKNYFEVLDVPTDSTEAAIKTAYKALARKYHPDKYSGNKVFATEALQYINVAYEVLSDDSKRKQHELSLNPHAQVVGAGGNHVQFNDNGQGFHFSFGNGGGGGGFSFSFTF
jgi:hypothetical protein